MLRFVLIALASLAAVYLLLRVAPELRSADLDWRGIAAVAGFVALAFYLRHVTEIGGIG